MRLGMGVGRAKRRYTTIFAALCAAILFVFVSKRLEPTYDLYVTQYANTMANDIVNTSISELFLQDEYDIFNHTEKNQTGKIVAIEADTAKINKFKSALLTDIQKRIKDYGKQTVHIPAFSASGLHILSGIGPKIPLHIQPMSIVNSEISDSFDSAGINNIKHQLNLKITFDIRYTGFMYAKNEKTEIEVPIAESVISGDIPYYYGGNIGVMGNGAENTQKGDV